MISQTVSERSESAPFPANKAALLERIVSDPVFFLETFCEVPDMGGSGHVPFRLNAGQRRYVAEVWNRGIRRDIVAKSRKWGFSTLRLALGLHEVMFREGRVFRVIAHRLETAKFLNSLVKTMYESAWKNFERMGEDPAYYLPRVTGDRSTGYEFGAIRSSLHVDTAGGKGVGQADRNDDLYLTEYSDWERAEDVFSGLAGSQPVASPYNRLTIDFNAHGTGSDAYTKYQNAKKRQDDADWNGFVPFFIGVRDVPEIYSDDYLAEQRRILGRRYPEVYPSNDVEMWLSSELAVFDLDDVRAAVDRTGGDFAGAACERYIHGVDTATGKPDGDWQVCITLGWRDGMWWQCEPALRMRVAEDVFAEEVDRRVREYPGVVVVERNVGSAVLVKFRELGTPGLYRHRDRDRDGKQRRNLGFPTTYGTKKIMISTLQQALRDGEIGLVDGEPVVQQLMEFEWKTTGEGEESKGLAGAPDRAGAHDDDAMALMLALQGAATAYDGPRVEMQGAW